MIPLTATSEMQRAMNAASSSETDRLPSRFSRIPRFARSITHCAITLNASTSRLCRL